MHCALLATEVGCHVAAINMMLPCLPVRVSVRVCVCLCVCYAVVKEGGGDRKKCQQMPVVLEAGAPG